VICGALRQQRRVQADAGQRAHAALETGGLDREGPRRIANSRAVRKGKVFGTNSSVHAAHIRNLFGTFSRCLSRTK
jgi:hypothetical protein